MNQDIPYVFSGAVEVDETYLGGQWKNKRKSQRIGVDKKGKKDEVRSCDLRFVHVESVLKGRQADPL